MLLPQSQGQYVSEAENFLLSGSTPGLQLAYASAAKTGADGRPLNGNRLRPPLLSGVFLFIFSFIPVCLCRERHWPGPCVLQGFG